MKSFYVLNGNFNTQKVERYDIMPYLVRMYNERDEKPSTFEEFKEFVKREGHWMWWGRCQYEIVIVQWPYKEDDPMRHSEKIDIWYQIEMNLDLITEILMENVQMA